MPPEIPVMSHSHISDEALPFQENPMFDNMKKSVGLSFKWRCSLGGGHLKQDDVIDRYDHDNSLTWLN